MELKVLCTVSETKTRVSLLSIIEVCCKPQGFIYLPGVLLPIVKIDIVSLVHAHRHTQNKMHVATNVKQRDIKFGKDTSCMVIPEAVRSIFFYLIFVFVLFILHLSTFMLRSFILNTFRETGAKAHFVLYLCSFPLSFDILCSNLVHQSE